jgi:phosphatidate cytidylyltransferase
LIGLASLLLVEERWWTPWFPALFVAVAAALTLGTHELLRMLDPASRPNPVLCHAGVLAILVANWRVPLGIPVDAWHLIGMLFAGVGIAAFLLEIGSFRGRGLITERLSQTLFVVFYLGVLPSFFLQLRFLDSATGVYPSRSTMALALTVFVPKCGDIGAYFTGKFLTGRILGRHRMTPQLSPSKTWQGAVGGILASIGVAIAIAAIGPVLPNTLSVVGFGLTVGVAGILGDLAESLLKRDRQTKDASTSVPGFGGVLDVIDSMLFAAPVAYLWFVLMRNHG